MASIDICSAAEHGLKIFLFENLQPGNSQKSNSQWTEINYLFEFRTGGVTSNGQMYHKHNHQD